MSDWITYEQIKEEYGRSGKWAQLRADAGEIRRKYVPLPTGSHRAMFWRLDVERVLAAHRDRMANRHGWVSTEERDQIIAALRAGDASRRSIAERFGRDIGTVTRIATEYGIPPLKRNGGKPARPAKAKEPRARSGAQRRQVPEYLKHEFRAFVLYHQIQMEQRRRAAYWLERRKRDAG